jgi:hypothetical protein
MAQRIKGQEVEIVVLQDGAPQDSLTCCRSVELTFKTELIEESYLGEKTNRYDSIFKGVSGKLEFHIETPEIFNVVQAIVDKAQRRTPGMRLNIKTTLNFPSGRKAKVLVADIEVGEMPINFGSRSDYGSFSLPFGASNGKFLPA